MEPAQTVTVYKDRTYCLFLFDFSSFPPESHLRLRPRPPQLGRLEGGTETRGNHLKGDYPQEMQCLLTIPSIDACK